MTVRVSECNRMPGEVSQLARKESILSDAWDEVLVCKSSGFVKSA